MLDSDFSSAFSHWLGIFSLFSMWKYSPQEEYLTRRAQCGEGDLLLSPAHRRSSLLCLPCWKPSGILHFCFASQHPPHLYLRGRMIIDRPPVPGALFLAADSKRGLRVCYSSFLWSG